MEQLPQDAKTEQSVLVSIFINQEHRQIAFEQLVPDDFYSTANRIIFEKCKELQCNGNAIETADIYEALDESDKKYVKADYLYKLPDIVPLAINIEHSIGKLKDAAARRRRPPGEGPTWGRP